MLTTDYAFALLIFALSLVALSSLPSILPLVLLLSSLQLNARLNEGDHRRAAIAWFSCVAGLALAHLMPSLDALSTPTLSIAILFILSPIFPLITFVIVYCDLHLAKYRSSGSALIFFPLLWASTWQLVYLFSPVGRLVAWSPMEGTMPYIWILQFMGPLGIDVIVGAWSVVLAEFTIKYTTLFAPDPDLMTFDSTPEGHDVHSRTLTRTTKMHVPILGALLTLLILPSYTTRYFPLPTYTKETTPFTVACAMPRTRLPNGTYSPATLHDYIAESRKLSAATIIIWPEGAIRFETPAARVMALQTLHDELLFDQKKLYVGISFEEFVPFQNGSRIAMKRNGFALVNYNDGIVFEYYKRLLVPIAESFSISPSTTSPPIYTIPLSLPAKKGRANDIRPIPVTSSICLDFASPRSFTSLSSRPAVILAPARTWHPSVGLAMFDQARQRALEIDTTIVWCDGGEGGVSGVIGNGYHEPSQFGEGSWTKTIGIPYPFNERRTIFMLLGDFGALCVLVLCGAIFMTISTCLSEGIPDNKWVKMRDSIANVAAIIKTFMTRRRRTATREAPLIPVD